MSKMTLEIPGDREEGESALLKAVDLRPRASDTLFRLAGFYLQENNFSRSAYFAILILQFAIPNPKFAFSVGSLLWYE